MRAGGAVNKHETTVALRHGEIKSVERDREAAGVIRNLPGSQSKVTNLVDGNGGAFGLRTLAWSRVRNSGMSIEKSGCFDRFGDIGATVLPERGGRGPVVFSFCERQTVLEFNDSRYFFPALVIVCERHDGAIFSHKRVDDMSVFPSVFGMEDARALRIFESELGFVVAHESFDDGNRIGAIWGRIDMNMMDGTRRPTVC